MRRALVLLAVVALAAAAILLALGIPAVQDRLLDRALARIGSSAAGGLFAEDALRVALCGTSSPFPHAERAKPCTAVFAAGRFWIVDTGPESWNNLALWRIPGSRIGAVLLTHFHSDHIGELGEFDLQTWVAGRPGPLRVFGPPGVERVVAGFEEAYALDTDYRIAHHGAELLDRERGRMRALPVALPAGGAAATVLEEEGLRITALRVDHAPVSPAYGYRFDYRGRSVVVSGDTTDDAGLAEAARDVDVLVHEAQANHIVSRLEAAMREAGRTGTAKILSDIPDYHTTPVEAATVANAAGAKLLVLTHLTPPPPAAIVERIFTRGVDATREGDWLLGYDGLLITLPADSDAVEVDSL